MVIWPERMTGHRETRLSGRECADLMTLFWEYPCDQRCGESRDTRQLFHLNNFPSVVMKEIDDIKQQISLLTPEKRAELFARIKDTSQFRLGGLEFMFHYPVHRSVFG